MFEGNAVRGVVEEAWDAVLGGAGLAGERVFFELGRSSLSALDLMARAEEPWSIDFPLELLFSELLRDGRRSGDGSQSATSEAPGLLIEFSDLSITLLGGLIGHPSCRTRPAACARGVGKNAREGDRRCKLRPSQRAMAALVAACDPGVRSRIWAPSPGAPPPGVRRGRHLRRSDRPGAGRGGIPRRGSSDWFNPARRAAIADEPLFGFAFNRRSDPRPPRWAAYICSC